MRFRKYRESEPESRPGPLGLAQRSGTARGQPGIHLHSGREQDQAPLESGKAEAFGKPVDGCRGGHRGTAACDALGDEVIGFAGEPLFQQNELYHEQALIGFRPVVCRPGVVHAMTIRRLRKTGGSAERSMIGLSMPSMRSRARCDPTGASSITKSSAVTGAAKGWGGNSCCPSTNATC